MLGTALDGSVESSGSFGLQQPFRADQSRPEPACRTRPQHHLPDSGPVQIMQEIL